MRVEWIAVIALALGVPFVVAWLTRRPGQTGVRAGR